MIQKKKTIWSRVLSDENIYMAIYSLENSLQNKELVSETELNVYRDVYNQEEMMKLIGQVKERLRELRQTDVFLKCKVFFKPKKRKEENIIFRPIHQYSKLLDAVAAISMLNVLIYEINDICMECPGKRECEEQKKCEWNKCKNCKNKQGKKLILSGLSRLMPSNFYGNTISLQPSRIYTSWQKQYREYTGITSEKFLQYHNTSEYAYEVDIDIENFFPSVDPRCIISYILEKLPVYMEKQERNDVKIILEKLLFVEIEGMDEKKIEENEKKLWFGENSYYGKVKEGEKAEIKFTVGIPQGLVQSYFFANIFMIEVAQAYTKVFNGDNYFYVDDSVIFTNEAIESDEDFREKIEQIELSINTVMNEYVKKCKNDNTVLKPYLENISYYVSLHKNDDKSSFTSILESKTGEIHLTNLCRAASQTMVDLNNSFSDNEDVTLRARIQKMLEEVCHEIDYVNTDINKLEKLENIDKNSIFMLKNYRKKLYRYKKFFKYREMILRFREKMQFKDIYENILLGFLTNESKNEEELIIEFFKNYDEDILLPALSFSYHCIEKAIDKKDKDEYKEILNKYWLLINEKLFGFENTQNSYLYQVYEKIKNNQKRTERFPALEKLLLVKYPNFYSAHDEVREAYINTFLGKGLNLKKEKIFCIDFFKAQTLVRENSSDVYKDIINGIISNIFNIKFDDSYTFAKNENRMLTYKEVRLLTYVRNYRFDILKFQKKTEEFRQEEMKKIDYSLLEVLKCFRLFVKEPDRIDDLIKIHQYTCDVWKNGSKYLYFYTQHNQEHAVQLIKNSIEIIKSIYFIKITKLDYYILFIACYLHDISMVTIPSLELFNDKNSDANIISTEFLMEENRMKKDSAVIKNLLIKYYQKLDEFYENQVRSSHAYKSGQEIRKRKDLDFIELCTKEVVAEVAEAHGFDVSEVYKTKSLASEKMYSKKFMQIILRLADLLDISAYRISKPILQNNLNNMSVQSSFHWISHILTEGYQIKVVYTDDKSIPPENGCRSYLQPKRIIEEFEIVIYVNMNQLTTEKPNGCQHMSMQYDKNQRCQFILNAGRPCEGKNCNFLCKWITKKNQYLFEELDELQRYLNDNEKNYYFFKAHVRVVIKNQQTLSPQLFDIIKNEMRK